MAAPVRIPEPSWVEPLCRIALEWRKGPSILRAALDAHFTVPKARFRGGPRTPRGLADLHEDLRGSGGLAAGREPRHPVSAGGGGCSGIPVTDARATSVGIRDVVLAGCPPGGTASHMGQPRRHGARVTGANTSWGN